MSILLNVLISAQTLLPSCDTTHVLQEVVVTSLKQRENHAREPMAISSFSMKQIEQGGVRSPHDLSLATPNLYLPDYGSKMTGSLYIRAIGTRMDQPAVALYVDNIPIMNKNNYDFDFFDVRGVHVLRGPQSMLYGRNAIGGVMHINTLTPFGFQGERFSAGYGHGNTVDLKFSLYRQPKPRLAYSLAWGHHSSNGFYTNVYNHKKADRILSEGLRSRLQWRISDRWLMDNVLSLNVVKQDGFAYSLHDEATGVTDPVNHNDPCTYDRFMLTHGTTFMHHADRWKFSATTSYQLLDDRMVLDQDFTPRSMFTLTQEQSEHVLTQELVWRANDDDEGWHWLGGFFGFYKHLSMDAPVTFKRDGIDELILANANEGIHTIFPNADLLIREDHFPIESRFKLPAYGLSLFHQSVFEVNQWEFTAGIRFDFEHTAIRYRNHTTLNYRLTLTMPDYKPLTSQMEGDASSSFFECMPRFAASYHTGVGTIYATVSRGYKAGGFNTQIFSDILQRQMMDDMMLDMGFYPDTGDSPYLDTERAISYKPEYSWNYEVGTHVAFFENHLRADVAAFYIDCRNQQLTVFPPGKGTGRLMSNAGHTRSYGVEVSLEGAIGNLQLNGNYGYTNAKFLSYDDGNQDYKGNRIPYAPENTVHLGGAYSFLLNGRWVERMILRADWQGIGKIWWNESNSIAQPFYGKLGASLWLERKGCSLGIWAKNLTDTDHHTFYFKSVGNAFVQQGKPRMFGVSLSMIVNR